METILVSWEKVWYGEKPKRNRMWDAVAVHASWNMLSWEMASLVWRVAVGWSLVNFLVNVWVVIDWTETDFKQPALKEQDATCSLSWSSAGFDNYEEKPDVTLTHWLLVSWLLWNPVWGVSVQQDVTHWLSKSLGPRVARGDLRSFTRNCLLHQPLTCKTHTVITFPGYGFKNRPLSWRWWCLTKERCISGGRVNSIASGCPPPEARRSNKLAV